MLSHLLLHIHDGIADLDHERIAEDLVRDSIGKEEVLALDLTGDGDRNAHVGVERHRNLIAIRALQGRLELSLHQVNNYRLISL